VKIKLKTCAICKEKFKPYLSTAKVCSVQCAISHAEGSRARQNKKDISLDRRERNKRLNRVKPITFWLNKVQFYCNSYIRERDKHLPCISCGTTNPNVQYCASHFRSRKAAPHLRFNEDNIHKACNNYCNKHLSGNIINYRPALIRKIGQERFDALMNNNEIHKYTLEECEDLIKYFKQKLKDIKKDP
jgi:hypothetical protein